MTIDEKYEKLVEYLKSLGSVAVAFSAGVDSTLLLHAANEALGDKALAITAQSNSFQKRELAESNAFCEKEGIRHIIAEINEFEIEGFAQNPENRCYICKTGIFTKIKALAAEAGAAYVVEGSNMDDLGDYRPGHKAIEELQVKSPLREAGLYKAEIRALSEKFGLPTWNKPSYACLATRFPYGETITVEKLAMVDKAEQFLIDKGFTQERVRVHGNVARIEVKPEEQERLFAMRSEVSSYFKSLGFLFVAMDLDGYVSGSMNKTLPAQE